MSVVHATLTAGSDSRQDRPYCDRTLTMVGPGQLRATGSAKLLWSLVTCTKCISFVDRARKNGWPINIGHARRAG